MKSKLSDFVAATFLPVGRQGGCVTYVNSLSNEKRRLKPAATTVSNIKSLNLDESCLGDKEGVFSGVNCVVL